MRSTFGVVDLFAGAGGLGEGFAGLDIDGHHPFEVALAIERDQQACRTLRLRSFLRAARARTGKTPVEYLRFHAGLTAEPNWDTVDAEAWHRACSEARCMELGTESTSAAIEEAIRRIRSTHDDTILIGGPPCQAYSLVGRARSRSKADYVPEQDARHYLFREYVRVLDQLRPAMFVMENVKGMLSSPVESRLVFDMLMDDLASVGGDGHRYHIHCIRVADGRIELAQPRSPRDFVVRAEELGLPQRRHRVFVLGLRYDAASRAVGAAVRLSSNRFTVADAIGNLPCLRSGLSRTEDSSPAWHDTVARGFEELMRIAAAAGDVSMLKGLQAAKHKSESGATLPRGSGSLPREGTSKAKPLLQWLERHDLLATAQHETRSHMAEDLGRYLYAAVYADTEGRSPTAAEFPHELRPDHRNWDSGVFQDRFRVQLASEPATTVTSHIAKDGHYFIHPDPAQCRSLTVREAARLQTFPDDFLFMGNRTHQYVQVGNAVPPMLADQVARLALECLQGREATRDLVGSGWPEGSGFGRFSA